uniref:cGMP-dependent protein kinase n=1 Tax=Haptolina ericina TaxID=156174 RepID=A0A7S3B1M2_9EUKA
MSVEDFSTFYRLFSRQRSYPEGTFIERKGLYLLIEGELMVASADGRKQKQQRGYYFGSLSDETGQRYSGEGNDALDTVTASTSCVCAYLTQLDDEAAGHPVPPRVRECLAALSVASAPRKASLSLADLEHVADLGGGGYGTVLLMRNRSDGSPAALKVLLRAAIVKKRQCEHVLSEVQLMNALHHPFIVELLCTFKDELRLFMVMEFVSGGELWSILSNQGTIPLPFARFVVGTLALVLEHIHSREFVYRDLKPENLMVGADGFVKLIDYGFCKRLSNGERTFTACGTVEYMAPEIVKLAGHSFEVDWWSLGVLMYECLHGYTPFSDYGNATDDMNIIRRVTDTEFVVDINAGVPAAANELIRALLRRDPASRADAASVRAHAFFAGDLDFGKLLAKALKPPYIPQVSDPFDVANFDPEIDDDLTGEKLLALEAGPYPSEAEWDADF